MTSPLNSPQELSEELSRFQPSSPSDHDLLPVPKDIAPERNGYQTVQIGPLV